MDLLVIFAETLGIINKFYCGIATDIPQVSVLFCVNISFYIVAIPYPLAWVQPETGFFAFLCTGMQNKIPVFIIAFRNCKKVIPAKEIKRVAIVIGVIAENLYLFPELCSTDVIVEI